jgi:hypothetical protein
MECGTGELDLLKMLLKNGKSSLIEFILKLK